MIRTEVRSVGEAADVPISSLPSLCAKPSFERLGTRAIRTRSDETQHSWLWMSDGHLSGITSRLVGMTNIPSQTYSFNSKTIHVVGLAGRQQWAGPELESCVLFLVGECPSRMPGLMLLARDPQATFHTDNRRKEWYHRAPQAEVAEEHDVKHSEASTHEGSLTPFDQSPYACTSIPPPSLFSRYRRLKFQGDIPHYIKEFSLIVFRSLGRACTEFRFMFPEKQMLAGRPPSPPPGAPVTWDAGLTGDCAGEMLASGGSGVGDMLVV